MKKINKARFVKYFFGDTISSYSLRREFFKNSVINSIANVASPLPEKNLETPKKFYGYVNFEGFDSIFVGTGVNTIMNDVKTQQISIDKIFGNDIKFSCLSYSGFTEIFKKFENFYGSILSLTNSVKTKEKTNSVVFEFNDFFFVFFMEEYGNFLTKIENFSLLFAKIFDKNIKNSFSNKKDRIEKAIKIMTFSPVEKFLIFFKRTKEIIYVTKKKKYDCYTCDHITEKTNDLDSITKQNKNIDELGEMICGDYCMIFTKCFLLYPSIEIPNLIHLSINKIVEKKFDINSTTFDFKNLNKSSYEIVYSEHYNVSNVWDNRLFFCHDSDPVLLKSNDFLLNYSIREELFNRKNSQTISLKESIIFERIENPFKLSEDFYHYDVYDFVGNLKDVDFFKKYTEYFNIKPSKFLNVLKYEYSEYHGSRESLKIKNIITKNNNDNFYYLINDDRSIQLLFCFRNNWYKLVRNNYIIDTKDDLIPYQILINGDCCELQNKNNIFEKDISTIINMFKNCFVDEKIKTKFIFYFAK